MPQNLNIGPQISPERQREEINEEVNNSYASTLSDIKAFDHAINDEVLDNRRNLLQLKVSSDQYDQLDKNNKLDSVNSVQNELQDIKNSNSQIETANKQKIEDTERDYKNLIGEYGEYVNVKQGIHSEINTQQQIVHNLAQKYNLNNKQKTQLINLLNPDKQELTDEDLEKEVAKYTNDKGESLSIFASRENMKLHLLRLKKQINDSKCYDRYAVNKISQCEGKLPSEQEFRDILNLFEHTIEYTLKKHNVSTQRHRHKDSQIAFFAYLRHSKDLDPKVRDILIQSDNQKPENLSFTPNGIRLARIYDSLQSIPNTKKTRDQQIKSEYLQIHYGITHLLINGNTFEKPTRASNDPSSLRVRNYLSVLRDSYNQAYNPGLDKSEDLLRYIVDRTDINLPKHLQGSLLRRTNNTLNREFNSRLKDNDKNTYRIAETQFLVDTAKKSNEFHAKISNNIHETTFSLRRSDQPTIDEKNTQQLYMLTYRYHAMLACGLNQPVTEELSQRLINGFLHNKYVLNNELSDQESKRSIEYLSETKNIFDKSFESVINNTQQVKPSVEQNGAIDQRALDPMHNVREACHSFIDDVHENLVKHPKEAEAGRLAKKVLNEFRSPTAQDVLDFPVLYDINPEGKYELSDLGQEIIKAIAGWHELNRTGFLKRAPDIYEMLTLRYPQILGTITNALPFDETTGKLTPRHERIALALKDKFINSQKEDRKKSIQLPSDCTTIESAIGAYASNPNIPAEDFVPYLYSYDDNDGKLTLTENGKRHLYDYIKLKKYNSDQTISEHPTEEVNKLIKNIVGRVTYDSAGKLSAESKMVLDALEGMYAKAISHLERNPRAVNVLHIGNTQENAERITELIIQQLIIETYGKKQERLGKKGPKIQDLISKKGIYDIGSLIRVGIFSTGNMDNYKSNSLSSAHAQILRVYIRTQLGEKLGKQDEPNLDVFQASNDDIVFGNNKTLPINHHYPLNLLGRLALLENLSKTDYRKNEIKKLIRQTQNEIEDKKLHRKAPTTTKVVEALFKLLRW